jgi:Na+/melibiose symporter-like transporter
MSKKVGNQLTFLCGIILNIVGACCILWGSGGGWVYIIFGMLGAGASVGMVMGLSITADMIGDNKESGAFVYGFMSFCDKFTCGLAIMFINLWIPG